MPTKPFKLLDLYCGAGGASVGYARAGFDVTGVDIRPQKNYPFPFTQGEALDFLRHNGRHFDAVHASPPCQHYSRATKQSGTQRDHPELLAATREALIASGLPYVIENVVGAPLIAPILLCGGMFPGLQTYRHRLFECSEFLLAPSHRRHTIRTPRSNVYVPGLFMTVYGHVSPVAKAREVMGINWPMNQREITNAIPPAYTRFIGAQLLQRIERRAERRGAG